jgi:VanZ family protein
MAFAPRLLQIVAWLLLVAVIVVTVGPIGWRPVTTFAPNLERALGLFIVGLVFALAYPRRVVVVAIALFTFTALLEAVQGLEPGRHARILDAVVKLSGGAIGLFLGSIASRHLIH